MGAARMQPIRDADGHLRPDLDHRWVPASVLALYEEVTRQCVYKRTCQGAYQGCIKRHGNVAYYLPRKIVGAA